MLARRSDDFISRYSEPPSAASLLSVMEWPQAELQTMQQRSQRRKGPGIYRQDYGWRRSSLPELLRLLHRRRYADPPPGESGRARRAPVHVTSLQRLSLAQGLCGLRGSARPARGSLRRNRSSFLALGRAARGGQRQSSRRSVLQCPQRRPRSPLDSGPGAGAPLVLSKDDAPLPCRQSRMRHSVLGSWGSTRLGAPCRSRDGGRVGRGLDQYLDRQRAPSSHKLARELAVIRRDVCIRCGT